MNISSVVVKKMTKIITLTKLTSLLKEFRKLSKIMKNPVLVGKVSLKFWLILVMQSNDFVQMQGLSCT